MPYDYYYRLSKHRQKIYRQSDSIPRIRLPKGHGLDLVAGELEEALNEGDRRRVTMISDALLGGLCMLLDAPPLQVRVGDRRPVDEVEELHGYYEPAEDGRAARISVWMRTAKRNQVVAFRTFLRTLLHELCHHLDYEHFRLEESFHTEGFYQRESSLFKQIVAGA